MSPIQSVAPANIAIGLRKPQYQAIKCIEIYCYWNYIRTMSVHKTNLLESTRGLTNTGVPSLRHLSTISAPNLRGERGGWFRQAASSVRVRAAVGGDLHFACESCAPTYSAGLRFLFLESPSKVVNNVFMHCISEQKIVFILLHYWREAKPLTSLRK